jgi:predicted RNA-binding protein
MTCDGCRQLLSGSGYVKGYLMCLNDGHFLLVQGDQETALQDVASLLVVNNKVRLVDVFGKHRDIDASIQEIDLLNNRIVLG